MSHEILVQYVGFESKGQFREYTFMIRENEVEPREYTLTIPNQAFVAHQVSYQDAPNVCSLKLQRELATYANHPPKSHIPITDAELADYRTAHTHKPNPNRFMRKTKIED